MRHGKTSNTYIRGRNTADHTAVRHISRSCSAVSMFMVHHEEYRCESVTTVAQECQCRRVPAMISSRSLWFEAAEYKTLEKCGLWMGTHCVGLFSDLASYNYRRVETVHQFSSQKWLSVYIASTSRGTPLTVLPIF